MHAIVPQRDMLHDTQQDISAPIILCPIHNGECKFTGDEILKAYQEQQGKQAMNTRLMGG